MICYCGKTAECDIPEPLCKGCAIEYYSSLVAIAAAHHEKFELPDCIFRWSPRDYAPYIKPRFDYRNHPCKHCEKLNIFPPKPIARINGRLCETHLYESYCLGRKNRKNNHAVSIFKQAI